MNEKKSTSAVPCLPLLIGVWIKEITLSTSGAASEKVSRDLLATFCGVYKQIVDLLEYI